MNFKKVSIIIFILAGLSFCFGLLYLETGQEWGDDFALYLSQAKALKDGNVSQLLEYNKWSMDNSEGMIGPYLYPVGLPILEWVYLKFFPFSWVGLKVFQWLIFVLSGFCFLGFIKKYGDFSNGWLIFLMSFYWLHPKMIEFSDRLMSDTLYLSLVSVFFYALFQLNSNSKKSKGLIYNSLILMSLIAVSLTRVVGFVLVGTWLFKIIYDYKNGDKISHSIPFFLIGLLSIVYIKIMDARLESNHVEALNQVSLELLGKHFLHYLELIGIYTFWHLRVIPFLGYLVGLVFIFILVLGLRREKLFWQLMPVLFFVLASVGILIIWPFYQGVRFLMPIMPFVLVMVVQLINKLEFKKLFLGKYQDKLPIILAAFVIVQGLLTTVYGFRFLQTNRVWTMESRHVYQFVQNQVPDSAIISFDKPRWLHYATGKRTIRILTDSFRLQSRYNYQLDYKPGVYTEDLTNKAKNNYAYHYRDSAEFKIVRDWPNFVLYQHNKVQ